MPCPGWLGSNGIAACALLERAQQHSGGEASSEPLSHFTLVLGFHSIVMIVLLAEVGEDWGWSFVTLCVLLIGAYALGGRLYYRKQGRDGWPHEDFWREVAGLASDGLAFARGARRRGYLPAIPEADGKGGGGKSGRQDGEKAKGRREAKSQRAAQEPSADADGGANSGSGSGVGGERGAGRAVAGREEVEGRLPGPRARARP